MNIKYLIHCSTISLLIVLISSCNILHSRPKPEIRNTTFAKELKYAESKYTNLNSSKNTVKDYMKHFKKGYKMKLSGGKNAYFLGTSMFGHQAIAFVRGVKNAEEDMGWNKRPNLKALHNSRGTTKQHD